MPFAAAISTRTQTTAALDEVCAQALQQLGAKPDLALLFFSPHHLEEAEKLGSAARDRLDTERILGCCGESIIGNDQEKEQQPALSLWLAQWPSDVSVEPFHLVLQDTGDGPNLLGWPDGLVDADPTQAAVLLVGDPFTFPVELLFRETNEGHPGLRVMGGMASGSRSPGESQLILGGALRDQGAVGVLLRGPIGLRSIVSQGCRPIGNHYVVTKAHDNLITELGGKAPLAQLQQLWPTLSAEEQRLFQQGLHVGLVINEYQEKFGRGDFLVRNVLGLERETGALAVGDHVRVGQTVQFHVRDAATADEDLHALLRHDVQSHEAKPKAALAFSCNGRGSRLFTEPHHDARAIRAEAGPIPVAGFFAAGELGPVGGRNFIHGFTASVVLFE
jgi:small ligand-binding sensory domain FIST